MNTILMVYYIDSDTHVRLFSQGGETKSSVPSKAGLKSQIPVGVSLRAFPFDR